MSVLVQWVGQFWGKSMFAQLTLRQQLVIDRITQHIVTLYGRYFLSTRISTKAPMLDLDFYFDLKVYKSIDIEIADISLQSVKSTSGI